MIRLDSIGSKLNIIACDTFGWIYTVLTSQTKLNFRMLSTQCFAGTRM